MANRREFIIKTLKPQECSTFLWSMICPPILLQVLKPVLVQKPSFLANHYLNRMPGSTIIYQKELNINFVAIFPVLIS